jgi:hypothetical protein
MHLPSKLRYNKVQLEMRWGTWGTNTANSDN